MSISLSTISDRVMSHGIGCLKKKKKKWPDETFKNSNFSSLTRALHAKKQKKKKKTTLQHFF